MTDFRTCLCLFLWKKSLFCFLCSVLLESQPRGERQRSSVPAVRHAALLSHVGGHGHCHLHEEEWHQLQHQPRCLHSIIRGLLSSGFLSECAPWLNFVYIFKFLQDKKGKERLLLHWQTLRCRAFPQPKASLCVSSFRDGVWPTGGLQRVGLHQAHQ